VRGAGQGITFPSGNSTVAVDSKSRIYGIESGPCSGGQPGTAHVMDVNLTQTGTITLGESPSGSATAIIPPE